MQPSGERKVRRPAKSRSSESCGHVSIRGMSCWEIASTIHTEISPNCEREVQKRARFAEMADIPNHTFWDVQDEREVRRRKVALVKDLGLDLFVEDDIERLRPIAGVGCVCVYVPQSRPDVGPMLLQGIAMGDWR